MNSRPTRGFTLIEVMIVVVIVGILAAVAYPSYKRHLVDSRRADAQIGLSRLATMEEKFFSQCNSYTENIEAGTLSDCDGLGMTAFAAGPDQIYSPDKYYVLTVAAGGTGAIETSFTATATPVAGSSQVGDGTFAISHTGLKQWDKDNNGSYDAAEATWKKH